MKILVTGANGQLGKSLRHVLEVEGSHQAVFTDIAGDQVEMLDITDAEAVGQLVKDKKIDVIVNCAAYTNVDAAEDDMPGAELLNRKAVANLAKAAKENDVYLIHISTDYVFGNAGNTPIKEEAAPAPSNVYGKTKLLGEEEIRKSGCKHIILRTAWLYSEHGRNFVKTMSRLLCEKDEVNVVFDQVGTPTYARDLASAILQIISDEDVEAKQGIYHFSDEGVCSWYDVAVEIKRCLNASCIVKPCLSSEFPSKVKRPPYSVLDKAKVKQTFHIEIPHWLDSLHQCMDSMLIQ